MFHVPNFYRHDSEDKDKAGNNGQFLIPHPSVSFYYFFAQASDGLGWEHVSVTLRKKISKSKWEEVHRSCTWLEMCLVKAAFWDDEDTVVQFHPPKSQYVSFHEYCLRLWRPVGREMPIPESILVGPKIEM